MANPFSKLINATLKKQYKYAISAIMEYCEVPSRFYYPITSYTSCTNCSETISGGSPNPFIAGNKGKFTTSCPNCGGQGKIPFQTYDDLSLCVIWEYNKNKVIVPGIVETSDGTVKTLSLISTTKIIRNCLYAVFNIDIEYLSSRKFKRKSEPNPIGFGGEDLYILTQWEDIS